MRFQILSTPLECDNARQELTRPEAGAYVSFEGWVRNHNEGREVEKLEYETYDVLANKEAEKVLDEAMERFDILEARALHRKGLLEIGDLAVWVGVSAKHRGDAFKACEYIIDEIKVRLPIWKKEYYIQGDSGWVNCERCAKHAHNEK